MCVDFKDNSVAVKSAMDAAIAAALHESAGELRSQAQRNTRVKSGQTKGSWQYSVDEGAKVATIGSNHENAIWEEFGTGEYAIEGNGRKGGWVYKNEKGEYRFTHGKSPSRAFWKAYISKKNAILNRIKSAIKKGMA